MLECLKEETDGILWWINFHFLFRFDKLNVWLTTHCAQSNLNQSDVAWVVNKSNLLSITWGNMTICFASCLVQKVRNVFDISTSVCVLFVDMLPMNFFIGFYT